METKELIGRVAAGAAALAMVFTLAACESPEDIQAKPDLAATLQRTSIEKCDPQWSNLDKQSYSDRLMGVFMSTNTEALRYLESNNITVCLDKRLAHEEYGFFESSAKAIYYPDTPEGRIISLWDNGNHTADHGFLESTAETWGDRSLEKFPDGFGGWFDSYETLVQAEMPMFGHKTSCGKSCTTIGWEHFENLPAHPNLQTPPVHGLT